MITINDPYKSFVLDVDSNKVYLPQTSVVKMYSMIVGDKEFTREYKCKSELEVLDAEIDFFSLVISEMDNQEIINKRDNGTSKT